MGAIERVFRGRRGGQERPAAAIVAGLWRNGEQGVWYDPSDLSTMYQDAAGTIPVYMPGTGQVDPPAGLILDKRLGLARGPELVVNGDFTSTSWWSRDTGVTINAGVCTYAAVTSSRGIYRSALTAVGKYYEITYSITVNSGAIRPFMSGTFGISRSTSGTYRELLGGTSGTLFGFFADASFDGTLDNVSLRELLGNHAYQATTTSRPTLSARYNLLTATEGLASAPWAINGTCTRTNAFATAPDGTLTATRIQLGTLATDEVRQTFSTSAGAGIGYTASIWLKSNTGNDQQVRLKNTHINVIDNSLTVTVTSDWQRFSLTVTNGASAGTGQLLGVTNTTGGLPKDILVWGADLRSANDGIGLPSYQRVVDANTYDTAGFPLRLKWDGVDDGMQTASVDFTGTSRIFVGVGARKRADTATGLVIELSTSTGATNPGSFALYASPNAAAQVGAIAYITGLGYKYAPISAPANYVQSVQFDASLPAAGQMDQRVNKSAVVALSGGDMGAGNFGNYAMYMGRRGAGGSLFAGYISQVIVCGKRLSAAEINAVEKLINSKTRAY